MQLTVLGLNHKTAPVEVRERFNLSEDRIKHILGNLRRFDEIREAIILSTCNRTEIYMVIDNPEKTIPLFKDQLAKMAGEAYNPDYFYHLNGTNCVRHLFRVAASLDSLIIGEGQILSQIKAAYQLARNNESTGYMLNQIMNKAIAVGKRVRTETRIAFSSVSVSSAAVDLAMEILGDLSKAEILVVGAGHMSELTTRHLLDKGAKTIIVSNRNYDHAKELADKFGGSVIPYREMFKHAAKADIIISSTGAPHYVLTKENLGPLLPERKGRPLVLIDIAVPRDIDPALSDVEGVTVYNIDDLEGVVDTNKTFRASEALTAEHIIEESIEELKERLRYYTMRPVMVQLHDKMNFLRQKVLKKAFIKLPNLTDEEKHIIDIMTQKLEHKFLREPMIAMNSRAGTAEEEQYRKMMVDLFLLNVEGEEFGDESKIDDWD
ncbi:MAG: glutamyl-tRNA reductase [Phascolarctobacterium sp.]|nr:glutamyl-tRNA reductase [Phascolarctobacterium sp.]